MLTGNNAILSKAGKAKEDNIIAEEKEQIGLSYASANMAKLGNEVTAGDLLYELRKSSDVQVTPNIDGTINVLYKNTKHNYKVNNGKAELTEVDNSTMAMFDTGKNVAKKMRELAGGADGGFGEYEGVEGVYNASIDAIKRYNGTPDLSKMTDANIVSWTDAYTMYEANPESYRDLIPEGTKLCPIYMWFEESGKSEIRDVLGTLNLKKISSSNNEKEVKTGTIYWWCESNNVYLNFDSSYMFGGLLYLSDISGLQYMKTDYTTNMSNIFYAFEFGLFVIISNKSLESLDAISCWNVSNVTDLSNAFVGYTGLKDINGLENWNVSNVTDMEMMFHQTYLKDASGINNWNIEKVTDFYGMFSACHTHPEFTKRAGTWDDNGTFTPNS